MISSSSRIQCVVGRLLLAVVGLVVGPPSLVADQANVRMRLKNGDYVTGQLTSSETPGHVSIRCSELEEPLDYDVQAIGSLEQMDEPKPLEVGKWSFAFSNSSVIIGNLVALTKEEITVESSSLGRVTLPRTNLTEIANTAQLGRPIFTGPRPGQNWKSDSGKDDWKFEAGALTTNRIGVPVQCDAGLTAKCEVRLVLSWAHTPNFAMLLGSMLAKPNAILQAAARIEVWEDMLVLVREVDSKVDLVPIGRISEMGGRISLVIHIDQATGAIYVSSPQGEFIGKVNMPSSAPQVNSKVQLINFSKQEGAVRLERLEVREWDGQMPIEKLKLGSGILDENGKHVDGEIVDYDARLAQLSLRKTDNSQWSIPLSTVRRIFFGNKQATIPSKPESVQLYLSDNSRIVGVWKNTTRDKAEILLEGMSESISIGLEHVLSALGSGQKFEASEWKGRVGTMETEMLKLRGSLVESSGAGELRWRAEGTESACKLNSVFVGKIEFVKRAETPASVNSMAAQVLLGGIGILGRPNPARNRVPPTPQFKTIEPALKFRSGDEVKGKVERIGEEGVTFTIFDQTKFVPHNKMEHVTLLSRQQASEASAAQLKRLMTVPRASKDDPPTHLFVSINGDYLRGRLVKIEEGRVTAEIRLAIVEFPVDTIAQIYWLHSRDWLDTKSDSVPEGKTEKAGEVPAVLQMHVINSSGKAVTFTPTSITGKYTGGHQDHLLQGENELLGRCEVLVSDVASILIGRDVGAQARNLQKEAWKLSIATLPKVYQEGEKNGESGSELIGKQAPDFSLKTTADKTLQLSGLRGRVLVLDFWASWCGPCIKTMPNIERIVQEVGGDQVELIAVNLQESKEKALAAIKRLGLSATVALDTDGNVAQLYQASAIPQTVIIDRQGKITHIFIGGGTRFLEQFSQALSDSLHKTH